MSSHEFKRKQVKCRKEHSCTWCGETIEIGEKADYSCGINNDNEFYSCYSHIECTGAMSRDFRDSGGDWDWSYQVGNNHRGKTEYEYENQIEFGQPNRNFNSA